MLHVLFSLFAYLVNLPRTIITTIQYSFIFKILPVNEVHMYRHHCLAMLQLPPSARSYTKLFSSFTCFVYIYICLCIFIYICIFRVIYAHGCVCVCVRVRACACICICMFVCMSAEFMII